MNRSRGILVLILAAIYSLIAALYPYEFSGRNLSLDHELPWQLMIYLVLPLGDLHLDDVLDNVVYFLPWGALTYIVVGSPRWRYYGSVLAAAVLGGALSLAVELCQIFLTRHPSVFDVLANTLGAAMGALLCVLSPIDVRRLAADTLAWASRSLLLPTAAFTLSLMPLLISIVNFPWINFSNWEPSFPFQVANEATLNRPWLGKLYLVAIYDRALDSEEIARHYRLGAVMEGMETRTRRGLVALYVFNEGRGAEVNDISGYGRPLNLYLSPPSHFRWLEQGQGLQVIRPAILTSRGPAEKIYDALHRQNELTVEVWVKPADVEQNGPARIVSLSRDPVARNFTVGQERADIEFRLRTPISGANGTAINLRTRNEFLLPERVHVVTTYRDGFERLYVDGREHPSAVDLKKADIIIGFGTKKNPLSKIAYSIIYFLPLSLVSSWVLFRRFDHYSLRMILSVTLGVALLGMAECFQAYVFDRPPDVELIGYGVVVGIVGALCGAVFGKESTMPGTIRVA